MPSGPAPSILVAPGGKIIYRSLNEIKTAGTEAGDCRVSPGRTYANR